MIYRTGNESESRVYRYVSKIQLAGTSGPLRRYHDVVTQAASTPHGWHAAEADLLTYVPGANSHSAIVIDLKPRQAANVSLYRLRDVWGFSYDWWTPLALHLETLFVDFAADDPSAFKREFTIQRTEGERVGEFLYLQGGTHGGTWNWGMVGRVNGALLWRDAFEYLAGELGKAIVR